MARGGKRGTKTVEIVLTDHDAMMPADPRQAIDMTVIEVSSCY
jgi:hypothetical protein